MATDKSNQNKGTAATPAPVEKPNWSTLLAEPEEVEAGVGVTMADIPQDVKDAVEQSKRRDVGLVFRLPSQAVAEEFVTLARQYAALREPKLTIRTTKKDDPTVVQFKAKDFEKRERKQK